MFDWILISQEKRKIYFKNKELLIIIIIIKIIFFIHLLFKHEKEHFQMQKTLGRNC